MKKLNLLLVTFVLGALALIYSCTTVNLTSWKDPGSNAQINNVVVLGLFEKLEVAKAVEESVVSYFTAHGLKCTKSLDFMAPGQQYSNDELKLKVAGLGADAVGGERRVAGRLLVAGHLPRCGHRHAGYVV